MNNINFGKGKVVLNDLDLKEDILLNEQVWSLKEDILQVEYGEDYILDVGFYPEFDIEKGEFRLVIVKGKYWDEPLFTKSTKSIKQLYLDLDEAINWLNQIKLPL